MRPRFDSETAGRSLRALHQAHAAYEEPLASVEPFLSLFLAAWTIAVIERVPSAGGKAELRRRIDRATAAVRRG